MLALGGGLKDMRPLALQVMGATLMLVSPMDELITTEMANGLYEKDVDPVPLNEGIWRHGAVLPLCNMAGVSLTMAASFLVVSAGQTSARQQVPAPRKDAEV